MFLLNAAALTSERTDKSIRINAAQMDQTTDSGTQSHQPASLTNLEMEIVCQFFETAACVLRGMQVCRRLNTHLPLMAKAKLRLDVSGEWPWCSQRKAHFLSRFRHLKLAIHFERRGESSALELQTALLDR